MTRIVCRNEGAQHRFRNCGAGGRDCDLRYEFAPRFRTGPMTVFSIVGPGRRERAARSARSPGLWPPTQPAYRARPISSHMALANKVCRYLVAHPRAGGRGAHDGRRPAARWPAVRRGRQSAAERPDAEGQYTMSLGAADAESREGVLVANSCENCSSKIEVA